MRQEESLQKWVRATALGGLCLAASAAANADWLVLRDGSRVETQGPWQQRGKLVVFTRSDGSLSSLRGSEVDLEASKKATEESVLQASKAAEPVPEVPKKKLAVITDKDLPRRSLAPAPAADKPESGGGPSPVTVTDWRKQPLASGEGLMVLGTLHNQTASIATNLTLEVSLSDEKGALLATAPGLFATRTLGPNGSVEFRANFPGVVDFSGVKFNAGGWVPEGTAPNAPNPPPPAAGAAPPPAGAAPNPPKPPAEPNQPPPPHS